MSTRACTIEVSTRSLDGGLHDHLREIVRADIARDSNRLPTLCLDLLNDHSRLLRIDTSGVSQQKSTTT